MEKFHTEGCTCVRLGQVRFVSDRDWAKLSGRGRNYRISLLCINIIYFLQFIHTLHAEAQTQVNSKTDIYDIIQEN